MLPPMPGLVDVLARRACVAVADVLAEGGPNTRKPTGEVSAVEAITIDGFSQIASEWAPILRSYGYQIELRPVFVHSRPHVTFSRPDGRSGTCELADLLVVIDHVGPGSMRTDRRAVLIQAKLGKNGFIRLRRKEKVQFELLSLWPEFTFKTALYDPRPRQFTDPTAPGDPDLSGEYGRIGLQATPPEWVQQLTQLPMGFAGDVGLGTYLALMTCGWQQYGREAEPGGPDDWSFTVDELLRVTAALPIRKSSAQSRGATHAAGFLMMGGIAESGGGAGAPSGPEAYEGESWPEGPLSTVWMSLRSEEHWGEGYSEGE